MKQLYRSQTNKIFSGIIGGVGEMVNVDPTIFRLIYLLVTVFTGFVPGALVYIFAIFIVPKQSKNRVHEQ